MRPKTDIVRAREQLAHQLGVQRIREALRKVEQAKGLLDEALSDLSAVNGGVPAWMAGGKVSDQIHGYYYKVAALRDRLGERLRVDEDHVDAELRRRSAAGGVP